jgi:ketosteroid isomerase-like protein
MCSQARPLVLPCLALVAAISLLSPAWAQTDRTAEKAAVERTFREYMVAFSAGDPKAIATYYQEPTMLVFPVVSRTLQTNADTEAWLGELRGAMKSRGVADVVIEELNVKMLGENIALLSSTYRRRAQDGSPLENGASSYFLRKSDNRWKIAAVAAHPPADLIKLD